MEVRKLSPVIFLPHRMCHFALLFAQYNFVIMESVMTYTVLGYTVQQCTVQREALPYWIVLAETYLGYNRPNFTDLRRTL